MKIDLSGNPEVMGIFGFSFEEKVASFMQKALKGTSSAKKLSSFLGAGGKNTTLVKNLYREYSAFQASGRLPADFSIEPDSSGSGGQFDAATISLAADLSNKTNVDSPIALEFLRALYVLSRDGKIPFAKWNPVGYQQSKKLQKTFVSENPLGALGAKSMSYAKIGIGIAIVATGAHMLSQIKGLK